MPKVSIRDRLEKLENHQRFLVWFVTARFHATLTVEELEISARGGQLPDPLPNRPSPLDGVDRSSRALLSRAFGSVRGYPLYLGSEACA